MLRLPDAWPRRMRAGTAAAYLDMSDREFSRVQALEGFPPPFDRSSRGQPVWLKDDLDRWIDGKTGQVADNYDEETEYKRRIAAITERRKGGSQSASR